MTTRPKLSRSNSDGIPPSPSPGPHILSRSISHDTGLDPEFVIPAERKNSLHVRPNSFCRQSSLLKSLEDVEPGRELEKKPKLIKNSRELIILIGMALIEFSGTCGMSVIGPFFSIEVRIYDKVPGF